MKTYRIILKTSWQSHCFVVDGENLDEAINNAKQQIDEEERVLWSTGQVIVDWSKK